ncbi:MAG: SMI1/KNR4 family protein [Clostridia bacterium]|nr:SMI1/KNR4 family protein [Clostridia bacterium]
MRFFVILDELKKQFKNNTLTRENGTILLGPGTVPCAEHMLFKPLDDDLIDEFLISKYAFKFPEEYIKLLKYTNGANLCTVKIWHTIKKKRIPTASGFLVIYGLPRTQPFGRPDNMEEPHDVRIEDLKRHDDIPKSWLHCGNYTRDYDLYSVYDIFIDSENGGVFSCVRDTATIIDSWNNLDDCLCSIYNSLGDREAEYEFNR